MYSQLFLFNCTVQWDFNGIIDTALAKSLYVKLCQIYLLNNITMEFLIESNLRSSVSHLFCATRVFILIFFNLYFFEMKVKQFHVLVSFLNILNLKNPEAFLIGSQK